MVANNITLPNFITAIIVYNKLISCVGIICMISPNENMASPKKKNYGSLHNYHLINWSSDFLIVVIWSSFLYISFPPTNFSAEKKLDSVQHFVGRSEFDFWHAILTSFSLIYRGLLYFNILSLIFTWLAYNPLYNHLWWGLHHWLFFWVSFAISFHLLSLLY